MLKRYSNEAMMESTKPVAAKLERRRIAERAAHGRADAKAKRVNVSVRSPPKVTDGWIPDLRRNPAWVTWLRRYQIFPPSPKNGQVRPSADPSVGDQTSDFIHWEPSSRCRGRCLPRSCR
jgi:hypothetical protein